MLTSLQIVAGPALEPVSVELARRHCRIDQTDDDVLLAGYVRSARTMAELYLSRALITQTLLWTASPRSGTPHWLHHLRGTLELPRAPVQSLASVTVLDERGNSTVIAPASLPIALGTELLGYIADLAQTPARLRIGGGTLLSGGLALRSTAIESLQVQFVAGYGAAPASVPQPIIDAILLTAGFLYEHRGDAGGDLPQAATWLLDPYRLQFVA